MLFKGSFNALVVAHFVLKTKVTINLPQLVVLLLFMADALTEELIRLTRLCHLLHVRAEFFHDQTGVEVTMQIMDGLTGLIEDIDYHSDQLVIGDGSSDEDSDSWTRAARVDSSLLVSTGESASSSCDSRPALPPWTFDRSCRQGRLERLRPVSLDLVNSWPDTSHVPLPQSHCCSQFAWSVDDERHILRDVFVAWKLDLRLRR